MFVGRINEINQIQETIKVGGNHVLLYGNRRVGKSTLAFKAVKNSSLPFVSFECLKTSLLNNVDAFVSSLKDFKIINDNILFSSLIDVFKYLTELNKRIVIIIDEFPYLYVKNNKDTIDSIFQNIIDNYSKNINLIIAGSHIGMMKTLVKSNNPLFGRFKLIIDLKELDYLEASEFYKNKSPYDKVAFYSVFGGSPYLLMQINPDKSLEENIINTFLNQNNIVNAFVSNGYTSDIPSKIIASHIFEVLGNSKLRHNRIEELLKYEHNGLLSKHLDLLLEMNFIKSNEPINKIGDKKKKTYSIANNALRFYYTYIYGKTNIINIIGADTFYDKYIKNTLTTFISLRFEDIAKSFVSKLTVDKKLTGVYNIGTYYYDDPINNKNGEFDLAIQRKDYYDLIEVKYLNKKVSSSIVNKEISQIKEIKDLKIKDYGFISINGFEDNIKQLKYMYDGEDIYFLK